MATSITLETLDIEQRSPSPQVSISLTPQPRFATAGQVNAASSGSLRVRPIDSATVRRPYDGITDQTSRLPFRRLISAYVFLAGIYFIATLDVNAVAVALPTIGRDLGVGTTITWAGTAYAMGQVAFQPLYGRFSDIFGRKPVLFVCVAMLILGDILCGLAQTATWLYVCRALSGVGGGGISSLISIIVSDLVSLKERGKYQGILSCAIGLGASAGPFLAAALLAMPMRAGTQSWRWIFYVPPMVAAACTLAATLFLPLKAVEGNWKQKLQQIDWMGLGAALIGMMCLMVPINLGGTVWSWASSPVAALLSLGVAAVIAFSIIEKKFAPIPMIPLHLFSQRSTAILIVQSALYNLVWQVDLYFIPAYLQSIRGYNALQTALLMLPLLVMQSAFGAVSGPAMSKLQGYVPPLANGPNSLYEDSYGYVLHPGMFLWMIGTALKMAYSQNTTIAFYVISMFITGWGIGFVTQPALVALQALCTPQDRAIATSTRNMFRMLGSVIGMTVATALQTAVTHKALPGDASGLYVGSTAILDSKMQGFRAVFAMEIPMMVLCCIGGLWIPSVPLRGDDTDDHDEVR